MCYKLASLLITFLQYFHPHKAEGYREAIRALRAIGKECVLKRIKALESGGEVPNDILSCILRVASRWLHLCLHPPVIHACLCMCGACMCGVCMCVCGVCVCGVCVCACGVCGGVCVWCVCVCMVMCDLPSGSDETADIETLVDDFVTFYVAGEGITSVLLHDVEDHLLYIYLIKEIYWYISNFVRCFNYIIFEHYRCGNFYIGHHYSIGYI